jgi:hypothetical protein
MKDDLCILSGQEINKVYRSGNEEINIYNNFNFNSSFCYLEQLFKGDFMNFFQGLGTFVSNIFTFLNSSDIQTIIQALVSLFGITVTLWVMLEAYKSFAGKSDRPLQELVWKITSAMLVIAVATNQNGFMETLKLIKKTWKNYLFTKSTGFSRN